MKKTTKKDLKTQLEEAHEQIEKLNHLLKYKDNVIGELKRSILANQLFREEILAYEAPVEFVECKSRKTSYLIFEDGHYTKVKLAKGDKYDPEVALMYLLVKNSYSIEKLKELLFNKRNLKVGEVLPVKINNKKR